MMRKIIIMLVSALIVIVGLTACTMLGEAEWDILARVCLTVLKTSVAYPAILWWYNFLNGGKND